jgi:hypothetical protein
MMADTATLSVLDPEEMAIARERDAVCDDCGGIHSPEARQRVVRRLLPCSADGIREAIIEGWPCLYGPMEKNGAGARMLQRDLHAMGSVRVMVGGSPVWRLR